MMALELRRVGWGPLLVIFLKIKSWAWKEVKSWVEERWRERILNREYKSQSEHCGAWAGMGVGGPGALRKVVCLTQGRGCLRGGGVCIAGLHFSEEGLGTGLSVTGHWPTLILCGRKPSLRAFELPRKLVPNSAELKFNPLRPPPPLQDPVLLSFGHKTLKVTRIMGQRRKA